MRGESIYSVMWEAKHLPCDVGRKQLQCDVGGKAFTVRCGRQRIYNVMWGGGHLQCDVGGNTFAM